MSREDYPNQTPNTYVSPLAAGTTFDFVSARTIFPYTLDAPNGTYYYQKVEFNGIKEFENRYVILPSGAEGKNVGYTEKLKSGTYLITYEIREYYNGEPQTKLNGVTYKFNAVENQYPIKKPTVEEVIDRIFDTVEPLCAYGYSEADEAHGAAAYAALTQIEDLEIGEAMATVFNADKARNGGSQMSIMYFLEKVGESVNQEKARSRAGGGSIDVKAALLYAFKKKMNFSREQMAGVLKVWNKTPIDAQSLLFGSEMPFPYEQKPVTPEEIE